MYSYSDLPITDYLAGCFVALPLIIAVAAVLVGVVGSRLSANNQLRALVPGLFIVLIALQAVSLIGYQLTGALLEINAGEILQGSYWIGVGCCQAVGGIAIILSATSSTRFAAKLQTGKALIRNGEGLLYLLDAVLIIGVFVWNGLENPTPFVPSSTYWVAGSLLAGFSALYMAFNVLKPSSN